MCLLIVLSSHHWHGLTWLVLGPFLQLLRNLQKMRDSYSAVAAGSDIANNDSLSATAEESSLVKLVAECEEALLLLNNGLSILSLSLERDFSGGSQGEKQGAWFWFWDVKFEEHVSRASELWLAVDSGKECNLTHIAWFSVANPRKMWKMFPLKNDDL